MAFECLDNCGKCCQPILMEVDCWRSLMDRVIHEYVEDMYVYDGVTYIVPRRCDGTNKCVFLDDITLRCTIYDERPQVCKDYGPIIPCPYVCPDGSIRSAEDTERLHAIVCMKYALVATLIPETEEELIKGLLELNPHMLYMATFEYGIRVGDYMRYDGGEVTKIDVPEELYPRLRMYLMGMGVRLPEVSR